MPWLLCIMLKWTWMEGVYSPFHSSASPQNLSVVTLLPPSPLILLLRPMPNTFWRPHLSEAALVSMPTTWTLPTATSLYLFFTSQPPFHFLKHLLLASMTHQSPGFPPTLLVFLSPLCRVWIIILKLWATLELCVKKKKKRWLGPAPDILSQNWWSGYPCPTVF